MSNKSYFSGVYRLLLCVAMMSLSACGIIKDRSSEYAAADAGQALIIPEGYSDLKVGARYPIPELSIRKQKLPDDFELPRPPSASGSIGEAPYLVETVGDQTWLRLYMSPGRVWPLLDFFWQEMGVEIDQQFIQQGFVLSKSISNDSPLYEIFSGVSEGENVLYAKLAQGVRRNTAELQVRVVKSGTSLSSLVWSSLASQTDVEEALLDKIGEYVSSDAQRNRQSLLANNISGEPRVYLLEDDDGKSYLKLRLSYLRAWNEIGKALEVSEVLVSDVDQSSKKYFVSYLNADELESWFISDSRRSEKRAERNLEIELISTHPDSNDEFEVRVKSLSDKFDEKREVELLRLIYEHIS